MIRGFIAAMSAHPESSLDTAIAAAYPVYSLDTAIAEFFLQTSATSEAYNIKANELVGRQVIPMANQGHCSYSVYAASEFEFVVQFRLKL